MIDTTKTERFGVGDYMLPLTAKKIAMYRKLDIEMRVKESDFDELAAESKRLAEALRSIRDGYNDSCAYDAVICPGCSCPPCKARAALGEETTR